MTSSLTSTLGISSPLLLLFTVIFSLLPLPDSSPSYPDTPCRRNVCTTHRKDLGSHGGTCMGGPAWRVLPSMAGRVTVVEARPTGASTHFRLSAPTVPTGEGCQVRPRQPATLVRRTVADKATNSWGRHANSPRHIYPGAGRSTIEGILELAQPAHLDGAET